MLLMHVDIILLLLFSMYTAFVPVDVQLMCQKQNFLPSKSFTVFPAAQLLLLLQKNKTENFLKIYISVCHMVRFKLCMLLVCLSYKY